MASPKINAGIAPSAKPKAILCRLINRWPKISPLEIILLRVSMIELGAGKKRTSIQLNLATISQIRMNAIGDATCTTLSLTEFSINTCLTYRSSGPPCNQRLHVAAALLPHSGSKLVAETALAQVFQIWYGVICGLLVRGLTAEDADVRHRSIEIRDDGQMNNIDRRDSKIRLPGSAI